MIDFDDDAAGPIGGLLPDSIIWTPEIERLNRFIIESIRMQSRGGAVMGQQCNGKSFATRYLTRLLPDSLGHTIAAVRWSIKPPGEKGSRTERAFLQERMIQSGCNSIVHRDVAVLWRRFCGHLAELAITAGSRWIVIMVDEAQNLSFDEYNRLIHCFNSLEDLKIKPFFLLVGQPELANTPASWKETNGMQVIGRFFTRTYWFRGICVDEIGQVLEAFDEPGSDGARLSGALMPHVAGSDWHLGAWGTHYKEALQMLMVHHQITDGLRVPMQMLRSSLLLLLDRTIARKIDPRSISTVMVLKALRDTGFTSSLTYYVDPTPGNTEDPDDDAEGQGVPV